LLPRRPGLRRCNLQPADAEEHPVALLVLALEVAAEPAEAEARRLQRLVVEDSSR
jgi:hypothetical protein